MYDFSIIIPHKNTPELLKQCLVSIPQRENIQVIVVDDNSNPAVVDFDNFPALGRPHTKAIFTKEEQGRRGAGYARNAGMAAAEGKWLVFSDADDVFLPALGDMMDRYGNSDADIVMFGNTVIDGDSGVPVSGKHLRDRMIEGYLKSDDEGMLRYCMWAPWSKFVKRNLVEEHHIAFSEIPFSNDIFFSIKTGHAAKKIVFDKTAVYVYAPRASSLTGCSNHNWETISIRFQEDIEVCEFLAEAGKSDYFSRHLVKRWKHMMRMDSKKAAELLPVVKKLAPPAYLMSVRLKLALDPVLRPLKKLVSRR